MANPRIHQLLKLQELDLRRRDLETRLVNLPKEMNRILGRRDALNAATAEAGAAVKRIELKIKTEESTVAELNAANDKLRQQSALVKKNNEYQAMLGSIELNRRKVGAAEERILVAMDELEESRKAAARVKVANSAEIKNLRTEFEELFSFSKVVKEELAKLKAARPALLKDIPPELLGPYEALLAGKEKSAPLVAADGEICGHCRLRVTPQTAVGIQRGELAFCDNCQFMLYSPEAL